MIDLSGMVPDKTAVLYKGKITLDFYDAKHLYVIRETGEVPTSVTQATGCLDKPGLKFWTVNLARDYLIDLVKAGRPITEQVVIDASKLHQVQVKKAKTIGEMVHDWIEQHIKGQKPVMPADSRVLNGVTAFLLWVDECGIRFLDSEKLVYSKKHGYAGMMDMPFTMKKERHKVKHCGDIKTGSAVYPEMRFQASGYQGADEEESGAEYGSMFIVRLDKETGEFDPHEFPVKDHKRDYAAFLGLLAAKRRLKEIAEEGKA